MFKKVTTPKTARVLAMQIFTLSFVGTLALLLLRDFASYRANAAAVVCLRMEDCDYDLPFTQIWVLAALTGIPALLMMVSGKYLAAASFPLLGTIVLFVAAQLMPFHWHYSAVWSDFFFISHASLLFFVSWSHLVGVPDIDDASTATVQTSGAANLLIE